VTGGCESIPPSARQPELPTNAQDLSAPHRALAQTSLDLAHYLAHLGPTPRNMGSREIQGHLSGSNVVPIPTQIENQSEADSLDLVHLVPVHIGTEIHEDQTFSFRAHVASSTSGEITRDVSDLSHLIPTNVAIDTPILPDLAYVGPASTEMKKGGQHSPNDSLELIHFVPDHVLGDSSASFPPVLHAWPTLQREVSRTELGTSHLIEFVPTHIMVEPNFSMPQAPSLMPRETQGRALDVSARDVLSDTPRLSQFMPVFNHALLSIPNLARLPEDEDSPRLSDFIPAGGSSAASTTDSIDFESFTPEQHQFAAKDVSVVLEHTPRLSRFVP